MILRDSNNFVVFTQLYAYLKKELRTLDNDNQLWTKNSYENKKDKYFFLPILSKIGDRDNQISYMPLGQCRKRSSNQKCFAPNT